VLVDEQTRWRGHLTGLADLEVGDHILAVGQWTPDGALLAATVARWRQPEPPIRLAGDVLALLADGFELGLEDGGSLTVVVDDETAWRNGLAGLDDLEVGDRVIVVGEPVDAGLGDVGDRALLASLVALWHEPTPPARVRGEVLTVLADGFEVAGDDGTTVTVLVDDGTTWRGLDGLDDLEVGDVVVAAGSWNDDGSLHARLVALWQPHQPPAEVHGEVLAVLADGFELQARDGSAIQVVVNDRTAWRGDLGGLDGLEAGMTVVVIGEWTGDATLLAHQVAPWRPPHDPVQLRGIVQTVHGDGFEVAAADGGTIRVLVDRRTEWRGRLSGLEDLEVGMAVHVLGQWTPDGPLLATHVANAPTL
jgi:hypothetical protein